jgi:hypothetical protein
VESSLALRSLKVRTPDPSMNRKERGMARSDMTHMIMCIDSGVSEMKSQKLSCAGCACGKPRSDASHHPSTPAWIDHEFVRFPAGSVFWPCEVLLVQWDMPLSKQELG